MRKLLFVATGFALTLLLFDPALAEVKKQVVERAVKDLAFFQLAMQGLAMRDKIIEIGTTAVMGFTGIGYFGFLFQGGRTAYRELRSIASDTVGAVTSAGAGIVGGIADKAGSTLLDKGAVFVGRKSGELYAKFLKSSPPALNTGKEPIRRATSLAETGAVGEGRLISSSDLLSGKAGSSSIREIQLSSGTTLQRTEEGWKAGDKLLTEQEAQSLIGSSDFLKATYGDGSKATLTKQPTGEFKEKLTLDTLTSPDASYRFTGNAVVADARKLSPDDISSILNTAPQGTKVSVIGDYYKYTDRNGVEKLAQHKVVLSRGADGKLKMDLKYASGRTDAYKEMYKKYRRGEMSEKDFLKSLHRETLKKKGQYRPPEGEKRPLPN